MSDQRDAGPNGPDFAEPVNGLSETEPLRRLSRMSREREEAGVAHGLSESPWNDPGRNFITETKEELADADNYVTWAYLQNREVEGLAPRLDRVRSKLAEVFNEIESAGELIDLWHGRKLRADDPPTNVRKEQK
jgi:hypothetical protein